MTVGFANATGRVSEGDGVVAVTVVKEGEPQLPVMVTVLTSDGTATGTSYQVHNIIIINIDLLHACSW